MRRGSVVSWRALFLGRQERASGKILWVWRYRTKLFVRTSQTISDDASPQARGCSFGRVYARTSKVWARIVALFFPTVALALATNHARSPLRHPPDCAFLEPVVRPARKTPAANRWIK